jgi:hypothetical protein
LKQNGWHHVSLLLFGNKPFHFNSNPLSSATHADDRVPLAENSFGYCRLDVICIRLRDASLSEFRQCGPAASLLPSHFGMARMRVSLGHLNAARVFVREALPDRE